MTPTPLSEQFPWVAQTIQAVGNGRNTDAVLAKTPSALRGGVQATIARESVGGLGDISTGRPKDGGRDTESQRGSMTTIMMTTTSTKVMLGTLGTVDS